MLCLHYTFIPITINASSFCWWACYAVAPGSFKAHRDGIFEDFNGLAPPADGGPRRNRIDKWDYG